MEVAAKIVLTFIFFNVPFLIEAAFARKLYVSSKDFTMAVVMTVIYIGFVSVMIWMTWRI